MGQVRTGSVCTEFLVFSGDRMRQITKRLISPESLEARLALDATFSQLYLQPTGNQFEVGHTIADLASAGTVISQGTQYYTIDGTSVHMTQAAVDHVNTGNALPLLEVSSHNRTASLVTRRFSIEDDLDVGYVNGGRQRDLQSMLVRKQDATENFHSAVYLRTNISSLNLEPSDTLVDASFTMYQSSGPNAEAGTVQLLVLTDASWNEGSLTYENRPYTASSPPTNGNINSAIANALASQNITTDDGKRVTYDISEAGASNRDLAFLLLAANQADPSASTSTAQNGAQRHYIYSSESSVQTRPFVSYSYIKQTTQAVDDSVSVKEGADTLLSPLMLLENDGLVGPSGNAVVASLNGTEWSQLPDADHPTFSHVFGYKQIASAEGTLYVRPTGRAYYEHSGNDVVSLTHDTFTYAFTNGGAASLPATITVTIEPENQLPTLSIFGRNLNPILSSINPGDTAATFLILDPEGDGSDLYWATPDGNSPSDTHGNPFYEIDFQQRVIKLTSTGANTVNAGNNLPTIRIFASNSNSPSRIVHAQAQPYVAHSRTFFINKETGSNTNDGRSLESPFQSTAAVLRKINGDTFLQPGDTVYFVGDYAADDYNPDFRYDNNPMDPYLWRSSSAGVKINDLHGTLADPITFKAWDDTTTVHTDDYAGFIIQNSSHIRIIGFEVKGTVEHISGEVASALQFLYRVNTTNEGYSRANYDHFASTDGTYDYFYRVPYGSTAEYVEDHYSTPGSLSTLTNSIRPIYSRSQGILVRQSKFIDVLDNHVHHIQGTAIKSIRSEYVNIIGNEVHDATRTSSLGTMGIEPWETTHDIPVESDQSNLYKIIVANNTVHHVFNEVFSWVPSKTFITPHLDEGKGISPEWQDNDTWLAEDATGRILIANNVTYLNALSGVNSHATDRVDIIHNTSVLNSLYGTIWELDTGLNIGITHEPDNNGTTDLGRDVRMANNVSVADGSLGGYALRVNAGSGRVTDAVEFSGGGNLVWNFQGTSVRKDPLDVAAGLFVTDAEPLFRVTKTGTYQPTDSSPLRNQGIALQTGWNLPSVGISDAFGQTRQISGIGAVLPVTNASRPLIGGPNAAPSGHNDITGLPLPSSELTVSHSVTDTDGIFDVTYQWLRDGVPIPSATSITYTLSPSDTGKHLSVEVSHRDGRGKRERVNSATVEALSILEDQGSAGLAYNSSSQLYLIRGSAALLPLQKDSSTPLQSSGLFGFSITAAVESSSQHMLRLTRSEVDYLLPIDDSGMLASLFHDLKNVQGTPLERTYISPDSYIQITASALGYLYDGQLNPIFEAQRGVTYAFNIQAPGYPLFLRLSTDIADTSNIYTNGVSEIGKDVGVVIWHVGLNTPDTLWYTTQSDADFTGKIIVSDLVTGP